MERVLELEVGDAEAGHRIDVAIAALAGISRAQARRWIDAGRVAIDEVPVARASRTAALGERLVARVPEAASPGARPEPIPLVVLHEDGELIVVDKPAGMVVHPAPGHPAGTLVNALLHHCGRLAEVGGVARPGIVHRLDRGTSGVMVAAKSDRAHHALARQFHDHTIAREYRALVRGTPTADEGRIDAPIGRHPRDRKRMSTAARASREAHTAYRVARRFPRSGRSWLHVHPETGRTHQIRVHLASVGLPIVGDPVYGRRAGSSAPAPRRRGGAPAALERALDRPALHAAKLGFVHPTSGEAMAFEAPLPEDLATLLEALARHEDGGSQASGHGGEAT